VKPDRDDKILTDWNALMIGSLAQAYMVLGNRAYLRAAEGSMRFILDTLYKDGRLLHVYKDGIAKLNGYLDDYAFTIGALIDLYEATFEPSWLETALSLNDTMNEQFWDDKDGAYFFASADHERLIVRSKNPYDNAVPSGNSVAVHNLLRLSAYTGRSDLKDKAERTLIVFHDMIKASPGGFGQLLCGLAWLHHGGQEIAVIGSPDDENTIAMLSVIRQQFRPYMVVALHDPLSATQAPADLIPLLADRPQVDGKPTVYVCRNFVCQRPVTTVEELEEALARTHQGEV